MNLILFDVSGTLVHSSDFEHKVLMSTMSRVMGVPLRTLEDFRKAETETAFVEKVWTLVKGVEPSDEDWETIYEVYHKVLMEAYLHSSERFKSLEGAPDLLRNLIDSKSWAFAIATTAWHDMAHLTLRSAGFYTRRIHVVTGEGIAKKKDLIHKAINSSQRWYGVDGFNKVTYVGDENIDHVACRELNIPFIEVGELATTREKRKLVRYPDKGQFIRLARRAVVPTRVRTNSLGSLIGIRA
ncbi:HAD family hydrolase [Phaeocystidibacter luteus]|uniref:phosphoglycolate phosphatase n=1 Tax=Phaeocystidibacter luteus TaxID=911197 RepID=A0A6N6RD26_9FLAO|nr:HAD hydrolase-like protein [Phaeocystidibacter luteus]KAB2805402.1 HAD hydrolase-like protein [Phaeocystidibacter luteus]